MSGMSGTYEIMAPVPTSSATTELRRISPTTRLVASSGYASNAIDGWDATLPKPYKLADLSAAIGRALEKR